MLSITHNFELFLTFIKHCFSIYRISEKNSLFKQIYSIGTLMEKNTVKDLIVNILRVKGKQHKGFGMY